MRVVLLASGVLCLLAGQVLSICSPVDYTLYVEKPECDFCVAINTTICMGFCYSLDPNVVGPAVKRLVVQRGCTYQAVEYRTAELPGAPRTWTPASRTRGPALHLPGLRSGAGRVHAQGQRRRGPLLQAPPPAHARLPGTEQLHPDPLRPTGLELRPFCWAGWSCLTSPSSLLQPGWSSLTLAGPA
ncbi:hypothetical protein ANANG_G00243160 [Anguilla anguilla]|uniref:Thyrotropin subunit beta n=1 Tax=Anguilla anguilla TaxID=7936 RepID=A0A9D3LQP5_ANGAN|nr:hypothetical protein ANANG_G00243160 [Anguilla anguilla]